jgi:hypothetical protein
MLKRMPLALVESPYGSDELEPWQDHIRYARKACHYCLTVLKVNPQASHLFYTQDGILNDDIPEQRALGIRAGLELGTYAEQSIFFIDFGFSRGMRQGYINAFLHDRPRKIVTLIDNLIEDSLVKSAQHEITELNAALRILHADLFKNTQDSDHTSAYLNRVYDDFKHELGNYPTETMTDHRGATVITELPPKPPVTAPMPPADNDLSIDECFLIMELHRGQKVERLMRGLSYSPAGYSDLQKRGYAETYEENGRLWIRLTDKFRLAKNF